VREVTVFVRIYSRDQQGEPEELGALVLKDGKLVQEPECLALTNLLREPLIVYDKGTRIEIDAQEEPERYLRALTRAVRGSYVWAGDIEE
jgi:hypothetical protein